MSVSGVREGRLCEGPSTSGHGAVLMTWTERLFQLCPHLQSIGLIDCKLHEGNGVGNLLTMANLCLTYSFTSERNRLHFGCEECRSNRGKHFVVPAGLTFSKKQGNQQQKKEL